MQLYDQAIFTKMFNQVKNPGENIVISQWDFDEKDKHHIVQYHLPSIRYINSTEIEQIKAPAKSRIVFRFEYLCTEKRGHDGKVEELTFDTTTDTMLVI